MDKELFEIGAELDVEALTARIREVVERQKASTPEYSLKPLQAMNLQSIRVENLTHEIQSGSSLTNIINQIPLKAAGSKGRLEFRVKKFLKWLVHWNTKAQADFNLSVTRSLELIVQQLKYAQMNFVALDRRLEEESKRTSEMNRSTGEGISLLSAGLENTSRKVDATTDQMFTLEGEISEGLEQLRKEANKQLSEQSNRLLAELKKVSIMAEAIGVELSGLERKADKEVGERIQSDFAAMDVRLQQVEQEARAGQQANERMSQILVTLEEVGKKAEAIGVELCGLERKMGNGMDETRIRLLRAERSLKAAMRVNDSLNPICLSPMSEHSERIANSEPRPFDHKRNGQEGNVTNPQHDNNLLEQSFDYLLFESRFRGSISEIKRRQSIYVDLFRGKKNVVDLGCGRGEFVELLSENGINVTGIDKDQDMADFCNDRGLRVVRADIFDYLTDLPDANLDGICMLQVIEHLSFDQISRLINLCEGKLRPGGTIVIETVNTNCSTALGNFYLDPSHIRPVPAQMLQFMLEQRLFKVEGLKFTSPVLGSDVNEVLEIPSGWAQDASLYQDYALIGHKY